MKTVLARLTRAVGGVAVVVVAVLLAPGAAHAATDRTPPTTPANLHVQSVSFTAVTLAWDASTDNSGTVMYDATLAPANLTDRVFDASVSFGGLAAGTTYTASVRAVDLAGNASAAVSVQFTTPARTLPPPTTPTNLRGVFVDGVLQGIAWDPSQSATHVSYILRSGSTVFHTGSATSVSVFTLEEVDCAVTPGGTYTLTVQAISADLDVSGLSDPLTVTIPKK
jgi:chitodextrinase